MPTVLQLRWPARRYHATPWSAHVNEGLIEWPPSPWRLLRALIATGFTKLRWPPDRVPELAVSLLQRLAEHAPSYALPPAATAHTRHYVDAGSKRPQIFDVWAHLDPEDAVEVVWPIDLPRDEGALLAELARNLGYLGRSESWVDASVTEQAQTPINCTPGVAPAPGGGWDSVPVLCPTSAATYTAWRDERAAALEAEHLPRERKPTAGQRKKLAKALSAYPADLIAALCMETGTLQKLGWSSPPGSHELTYWRRADALSVSVASQPRRSRAAPARLALLALSTASRSTSALPPVIRAYPQGRLLHRALASLIDDRVCPLAEVLLGVTPWGRAEGHRHAHLMHLDLTGSGRLDHALIYAPAGLDPEAQATLRRLRRTYMKGGAGELQLALAAVGEASDLRRLPGRVGRAMGLALGPPGGCEAWLSATPFVAPRMLKKRGRDSLDAQVRLECERRGLPQPEEIEVRPAAAAEGQRFRHYILHDAKRRPPWPTAYALRLRFPHPVEGPIALGYGAHAGLGRLEARAP